MFGTEKKQEERRKKKKRRNTYTWIFMGTGGRGLNGLLYNRWFEGKYIWTTIRYKNLLFFFNR